jgi:hypothetical protein
MIAVAVLLVLAAMVGGAAAQQDSSDRVIADEAVHEQEHAHRLVAAQGSEQPGAQKSCNPPVSLRDRVHARLEELKELPTDVVTESTFLAVQKRVERGDNSFDLNRHCDARDAYQSALDVAVPALRHAYRTDTRHLLNETGAMIRAERSDGNPDADIGSLEEQLQRQRRALRDAQSLDALRAQHDQAEELRAEARRKLPTSPTEQFAEGAGELLSAIGATPFMTALALLFGSIAIIEAYLLYDRASSGDGHTERSSARGD